MPDVLPVDLTHFVNGNVIGHRFDGMQQAMFGMAASGRRAWGFWKPDGEHAKVVSAMPKRVTRRT